MWEEIPRRKYFLPPLPGPGPRLPCSGLWQRTLPRVGQDTSAAGENLLDYLKGNICPGFLPSGLSRDTVHMLWGAHIYVYLKPLVFTYWCHGARSSRFICLFQMLGSLNWSVSDACDGFWLFGHLMVPHPFASHEFLSIQVYLSDLVSRPDITHWFWIQCPLNRS